VTKLEKEQEHYKEELIVKTKEINVH